MPSPTGRRTPAKQAQDHLGSPADAGLPLRELLTRLQADVCSAHSYRIAPQTRRRLQRLIADAEHAALVIANNLHDAQGALAAIALDPPATTDYPALARRAHAAHHAALLVIEGGLAAEAKEGR